MEQEFDLTEMIYFRSLVLCSYVYAIEEFLCRFVKRHELNKRNIWHSRLKCHAEKLTGLLRFCTNTYFVYVKVLSCRAEGFVDIFVGKICCRCIKIIFWPVEAVSTVRINPNPVKFQCFSYPAFVLNLFCEV